jgi:glycerol-3-phosphate dehydrogenase (NAD+)
MVHKVAIIGSGNWGSAIARLVGQNCLEKSEFEERVNIWVYEETITLDKEEHKLTEYINTHHENVKYLPGIKLPHNVVAVPDIKEAVKGANILIFVLPHQFVLRACSSIKDVVEKDAFAISLCKGFEVTPQGLVIISSVISEQVGVPCGALMGANLAREVALDQFAEATIATANLEHGKIFQKLFNRPSFRCACVGDNIVAVEVCGALKNVIGVGAGFVDALECGNNTKCAIIRLGLMEMMAFAKEFYDCQNKDVFFESCGIADLVTTCYGGRHARLGKLFVQTGKSFEELEQLHLNGQKLQGHAVAEQVFRMLESKGQPALDKYPLMVAIYRVAFEKLPAADLFACLQNHPEHM